MLEKMNLTAELDLVIDYIVEDRRSCPLLVMLEKMNLTAELDLVIDCIVEDRRSCPLLMNIFRR
jgi:hypothetical protein